MARGPLLSLIAALCLVAAASPSPSVAQGYQTPQAPPRIPSRTSTPADEKKAKEVVTRLYAAAQTALAAHRYAEATKAYEEALKVLEALYGAVDVHLVEALSGVVVARMSWDSYTARSGGGARSGIAAAVKAQERIVKIHEKSDEIAPNVRVASVVDLGDVYTYTGDERAVATYREAAQLQANLGTAASADALFASVAVVRLVLPPNPLGHEDWAATVTYDVGANGRALVSEVTGTVPDSLAADIRKSYGEGRFRPRFVGGEPVATTGISSTHKYPAAAQ